MSDFKSHWKRNQQMNDQKLLMDLVGWVGAATLLIAYLLVSKGKVSAKTIFYQNLNIFGSLCLVINTYYFLL